MERQLPRAGESESESQATRNCSPDTSKFAPSNPGKILSDFARFLLPGLSLARRLFGVRSAISSPDGEDLHAPPHRRHRRGLLRHFLLVASSPCSLHRIERSSSDDGSDRSVFPWSFRYGFMFGRESARKELGDLIDGLRRNGDGGADSTSPA